MRKFLYSLAAVILVVVAYVVVTLSVATAKDWQPSGVAPTTVFDSPNAVDTIRDSVFNFITWNVGYGGLGVEADFFLDAGAFYVSRGAMVHSPPDHVELYSRGIREQLGSFATEFVLLQEVDSMSDRSYNRPALSEYRSTRPNDYLAFAPNYIASNVAVPVFEPWNHYGAVHSGLASFSKFRPSGTPERHQLPGEFPWPDRVFQLDRCLLVQRHPLADGRTLTVVNLHLSAYDDGSLKAAQLDYLRTFLQAEEDAGHLVVAGGDWNLVPPNFPYDRFIRDPDSTFATSAVPENFPNAGWTYVYDARMPTNRKINAPYLRDSSFVTLIDFFLLSPGLRARAARGIRQDFQYSDHQPVWVEVELEE